ncbi:hypothetical protein ISF_09817 [Cordyceps fumosorosea ARSEF 2679]|uniref:Uncharacterized protein n=1 Tax=Cordyceps fumosorosea (strain ARSEF 2679) TaxID=1081104 RepID=A0A167BNJ5_CORFA|nr:hypothetical protein ISF_09817 [Cordyceps fumosorosea ARSEF 2679]OAA40239.1 hypothetical protein ISF_09817 [Cordyceps fumosorosea ARSEF 2679]
MRFQATLSLLASFAIPLVTSTVTFAPDKIHAENNAHSIFNSVHSAGRQWGSSINHNGFALIPGVVPRGSVFYHAAATPTWLSTGPARLDFEPEAAEAFAADWFKGCRSPGDDEAFPGDRPRGPGYMHTYRNKRDLKVLLADGLSAGQTGYGTLDTQDVLLLENRTLEGNACEADHRRAHALCDVVGPWGYDGVVRAGLGFELLLCNVTGTIWQMKVKRAFSRAQRLGDGALLMAQWVRAAAQRYDTLGARLRLDFSSMVSGLFYPVNTTNPDPSHPERKRLAATPLAHLRVVKHRIEAISRAEFQTFLIDWRYIVDTIVTRFAERLAAMADPHIEDGDFVDELEAAALTYIDATALEDGGETLERSIRDCTDHYLYPALPFSQRWNEADHMLYHAVITVLSDVCRTLIRGWSDLLHASNPTYLTSNAQKRAVLDGVKAEVKELTTRLAWTTWRRTRACAVNQAELVAMWPYGDLEDHKRPGCRARGQLSMDRTGYWGGGSLDVSGEASLTWPSEEL